MGFFDSISNFAGNITGGLIGESDAEKASKDAKKLSSNYTNANILDFKTYFGETEADFQPYLTAGSEAIRDLMESRFGDPSAPELARFAYPDPEAPELDIFRYAPPTTPELERFVFDATKLGGTDAYQWRYGQGLQATERALASNRSLSSGNRLTALQEYGQGAASQEYENEWSRQLTQNLQENERRITGHEMDVTRFGQNRQKWLDENNRRVQGYDMDVGRFNREAVRNEMNNQSTLSQYMMGADRYRSVIDRLTGLANQGQTAATNLASQRLSTTGGISGARGQNAANQFASSLIPVQEKQQFTSGLFDIGGTVLGKVL